MMIPPELVEAVASAEAVWRADYERRLREEGYIPSHTPWRDMAAAVLDQLPSLLASRPDLLARDPRFSSLGDRGHLQSIIDAVLCIHLPQDIYSECNCPEDQKVDGRHVEVEEVGLTCELVMTICQSCCCDTDGNQSEECFAEHFHGPDIPICPTVSAISGGGLCLCSRFEVNLFCPMHGWNKGQPLHAFEVFKDIFGPFSSRGWSDAVKSAKMIEGMTNNGFVVTQHGDEVDHTILENVFSLENVRRQNPVLGLWEALRREGIECNRR